MSSLINFNRFEDLIDVFFHADVKPIDKNHTSPNLNAKENDKEILLSFELPGFAKEDIDIHLEENQLIVSAIRPPEKMNEESKWLNEKSPRSNHIQKKKLRNLRIKKSPKNTLIQRELSTDYANHTDSEK